MGIDFDILEHCKKVRADHGPPYTCPIQSCSRTYKSVCGLQYHLKSYDHDNPIPPTPTTNNNNTTNNTTNPPGATTPKSKKGGRGRATPAPALAQIPVPEPLSYEEAQKMVQFETEGLVLRWNINDDLDVKSANIPAQTRPEELVQLPEAHFKELEDYFICDAPSRPNAYIRFIEKSVEELDGEVEYDVDEEDTAWLALMNEKRETQGLSPVSVDSLELLMDRLEKESYFQATATGHTATTVVDDDAVCCICMDGECQNSNVILFCDMCNLAVHQDCYGVPYIPEGQWLCRRCLQSPSRAVDCVLCPNQGGAFKQTDRSQWAHVVCALWIPEVRFANTVFLEPIDSIEMIPTARWKLTCYVCKQKGVGACIQCHKTNCYSAFHVTCAQQAGLYMKMDTVKDGGDSQPVLVQKIAYCDAHTPADATGKDEPKKEEARQKMKKARKMLAKKRTTAPIILIPTIPPERIQEIGALVTIAKKSQFIQRLIAYWTLKRQHRNGVPLLRRLQSAQGGARDSNCSNVDTIELCRQLKYWQCLRQDLERARLLCELVRKREKLKLEATKVAERCLGIQLKPLEASLRIVLDMIAAKDTNEIFSEPVDLEEVPDYTTVVTEPMDLSTMRKKLDESAYPDLTTLEKDFDLMIANCLAYNSKDTVFYRAAIKMRDQCGAIFRQARKELESCGLLDEKSMESGMNNGGGNAEESLAADIDRELESLLDIDYFPEKGKNGPEVVAKLEELLAKSQALKHGMARAKRVKIVRGALARAKRYLAANRPTSNSDTSASESENEHETKRTGNDTNGPPGGGVNRRTAILFTKKAQAALKKPQEDKDGENKQKKKGRPRRNTETTTPSIADTHISQSKTNTTPSVPDSFKVYRAGRPQSGDDESLSSLSTCYSYTLSEIDSDEASDTSDDLPPNTAAVATTAATVAEVDVSEDELQPLQLVWAKCRGYPWYPALIIDPTMPEGYIHCGVPLPTAPPEVMALKSNRAAANNNERIYLVLFFDAKRTWQWLPRDKLEILGLDRERDEAKANEPRKPTDRKAVRKAYRNALHYETQIANYAKNEQINGKKDI